MNQDVYIFEVTEKTFPTAVIQNSEKLPVIVLFMGAWSEPCFISDALFSGLAKEFSGQFIFAKVDIDEQPDLRKEYQIQNVPTVKVFHQSAEIRTEEGQLNESESRDLLKSLGIFHESDAMREEARNKHLSGDTSGAILLLTQAIQKHPSNTRVAMDMVQIFIDIEDLDNSQALFGKLPDHDKNSDMGKALSGQLIFLELASKTAGFENLQQKLLTNPDDHQSRFDLAICQIARHQIDEAMDNLFKLMTENPNFLDGAPREMIVTLIQMLTPSNPEQAKTYQRMLSNQLAQ